MYRSSNQDDDDRSLASDVSGKRTPSVSTSSSKVGGGSKTVVIEPDPDRHRFGTNKLHMTGPITIELIEDYLASMNPNKRSDLMRSDVVLSTATGGYGIANNMTRDLSVSSIDSSSTVMGDVQSRLRKLREQERKEDDTFRRMRRDLERQLMEINDATFDDVGVGHETLSYVGSGMHKLEQVSVLSGSSNQRAEMRKRTARLMRTHMPGDENELSEEVANDNASGVEQAVDRHTARLLDTSTRLPTLHEPTDEEMAHVRLAEFLKMYVPRADYDPKLPITKYREAILSTISENPVSIILGGTGCGKTTQVSLLAHYHD